MMTDEYLPAVENITAIAKQHPRLALQLKQASDGQVDVVADSLRWVKQNTFGDKTQIKSNDFKLFCEKNFIDRDWFLTTFKCIDIIKQDGNFYYAFNDKGLDV